MGPKRKNTLKIEFHEVGFIPPFWVGFSKQGKKPGWRTSSNCVQNELVRLSPSGRNEKKPLGSNSMGSVSYHHFEWAFPSRAKSRVDERRPLAFKTNLFDFPHRGETKKNPWDRIPWGRFHTTILSGLFQAGQKAGLTNVVHLRSKRTCSTFPIGAKRKKTLGIEFHGVGFIPPFWVGFSKQGISRVDERRPIALKTRFFDFPYRGETKKHPCDRIPRCGFHTTILSGLFQAGQKAGLTNVVQLRSKRTCSTFPIGAKWKNTLKIEFHEVGFIPPFWVGFSKQGKKPGWRTSSYCAQNAFFRFSPWGRNEKTPLGSNSSGSVSYHHFEWAFPSRPKSRVDERRHIALKTRFFDFPHGGEIKKHSWDRIPRGRFHTTILSGLFQAGQKAGLTNVVQLGSIEFVWLSPSGRNEKTPLRSNSTRSVSYHHFEWAFPSRAKSRGDERRPIALKTRFFDFPHGGETKKHPWDRIPWGRFHTTILSGLFQAGQKAGLTNVVQLGSNEFVWLSPSGQNEKTPLRSNSTRSVSYHHFEWAFPSRAKSRVDERRHIALKTRFFDFPHGRETKKHPWDRIPRGRFHTTILSGLFQAGQKAGLTNVVQMGSIEFVWLSPSGRNEKTPLRSNSTRSVSYHHFEWAFPSRAKSRGDERRPIALKTRFFDFPHGGETKKHPWDRIPRGRFHTTILSGLFQAGQKAGLTNVVQLRSKRTCSTFPIGAKRKNTLKIEFHEVGFIPPFWVGFSKQGKKPGWRTSSNCVQNELVRLSLSGRNEKTPLRSNSTRSVSYHHFEWAFPSRAKSRVDELRPSGFKRICLTFPIGAKWKNTVKIEFHEVGFIPPFWVGFSKQGKKPGWRTSSNCAQNAFFRFSPWGRNEKTPLGSNSMGSVSYHHFEWAFPSRAKSRGDERRPIAFKTNLFDFPHRGETKKHPCDRIPRGRFHTTILSGLFQAGQKAGVTNVVQLRSKRTCSTFPIGAKRKNTLAIEFHEVGFIPPFWVGFSKQGKKPGWRTSSNWVQTNFFDFPHRGEMKKHP